MPGHPERRQTDTSQHQRADDLHERALIGGIFYVLTWLLVAWQGGLLERQPALAWLFFGVFVVLGAGRLLVRRWCQVRPQRAAASLRAQWGVLLATAGLWGALSAWMLWDRSFAAADTITLLATVSLAMAFAQIFAVNLRIVMIGTGLLFLPMLVIVLVRWEQPGVALLLLLNLVYLVAVIARSHREYEVKLALDSQLREQRDRFATQSRTDALTGLANRGHFQAGLEQQVEAARGGDGGFAVAFLIADLDHFKAINDRHGHAAGDGCLREVAARLERCFQDRQALVARLGGEEFGVLLSGDDAARIAQLAEDFRASLASEPVRLPSGEPLQVTASVGLAVFAPGRHRDGDALYAAADEALYRAKKAGRNRVETA